ncbi:MAG: helix-turn-helix domain-containing protein [Chloroflexi bacterium]|nr:helix-turn-helix domain-containing protein [Chloroflexota bacterium]
MTHDDVLYRFRLRLFALAEELGNVRAACRILGVHPSTYYRWRKPVRHIEAAQPGDLVQLDCFHVCLLAGSRGRTWQYTAIDVATSYTWAPCTTPRAIPPPATLRP